jgi:hypothetical protein
MQRAKQKAGKHYEYLSAGITVEQIIESFTTPGKQFEFPVKSIPVSLDRESRQTILQAVGLLALGAVVVSAVVSR